LRRLDETKQWESFTQKDETYSYVTPAGKNCFLPRYCLRPPHLTCRAGCVKSRTPPPPTPTPPPPLSTPPHHLSTCSRYYFRLFCTERTENQLEEKGGGGVGRRESAKKKAWLPLAKINHHYMLLKKFSSGTTVLDWRT
jgi:hypothetical protein